MSSLKQFSKDTFIYGAGYILVRFVSFLLVPIYTNSFSQSEYGTLALIFAFIGFMQIFYNHGMASSLMKFYDDDNKESSVTIIFSSLFIISLIFTILMLIFSRDLSQLLLGANEPYWIKLISGILFFDAISVRALILFRMDGNSIKYIVIALISVIITMGANIVLVVQKGMGISGALQAALIASLATFLLTFPKVFRTFRIKSFSRDLLKDIYRFGFPFISVAFFQVMMDLSDRYLLDWMLIGGREAVGVYNAGYKLGSLMLFVVTGFNLGWQPYFLKMKNNINAPENFSRIATWFVAMMVSVWVLCSLFVDQLISLKFFGITLVGEKFHQASDIIPVIMLSYIFLGFYDLLMPGIFYKSKSKALPVFRGIGAVSNIILNLIFIPIYGISGASWATCVSFAAMSIPLYFYSQKLFFIPFNWKKIILLFVTGVIIFTTSQMLVLSSATSFSMIIIYLLILFLMFRSEVKMLFLKRNIDGQ